MKNQKSSNPPEPHGPAGQEEHPPASGRRISSAPALPAVESPGPASKEEVRQGANGQAGRDEAVRLRLAALVESSEDAIIGKTLDGIITDWNRAAERLYQYTAEEAVGQPISIIVPPDKQDELARIFARLERGERVEHFETVRIRKDGTRVDISLAVSPIQDSAGRLYGASAIARDISLQKEAEALLRKREQQQAAVAQLGQHALRGAGLQALMEEAARRIAAVLEADASLILELPAEGHLLARAGFGWRQGVAGQLVVEAGRDSQAGFTLLSKGPVVIEDLRAEDRFRVPPLLLEHGIASSIGVIIYSPDGPYGVLEVHARQQRRFTQDEVNFMQAVANLLGEAIARKRTEEALQESESFKDQIIESSKDCIKVLNLKGELLSMNVGGQVLLEIEDLSEVVGTRWVDFWEGTVREAAHEAIRTARAGGTGRFSGVCPTRGGEPKWWDVIITPIRNAEGKPQQLLSISRDITEQKRNEEVVRLLAEASMMLAESLHYETTMSSIARLMVPAFADWCVIDVLEEETLRPVAVAHVDPSKVELARELRQRYPLRRDAPTGVAKVLRTGEAELYPEVTDELLQQAARDEEHLHILRSLGLQSAMTVPLVARGRTLGAITLILAKVNHRYGEADLAPIEELARICALAIDNARLFREAQREISERARAEQEVERLNRDLKRRVDELETLLDVVPIGIGVALDASCSVIVPNPAFAAMLGVPSGANTSKSSVEADRLPFKVTRDGKEIPAEELPIQVAARQNVSIRDVEYDIVREDGQVLILLEYASPLHDEHGNVRGAIGAFVNITEIRRAEAMLQARLRELEILHNISTDIVRARHLEEIYASALDAVLEVLNADRASLLLFDEDGVLRFKAWRGLSPAYRAAVEGHSPWSPDTRDPEPITISDAAADASLGAYQETILAEGIRGLAFIPLSYEGRLLGKFMAYFDAPHAFSEEELRLAQTLANHVAFSIERGRAEESLRLKTRTLETVNRINTSLAAELDLQKLVQAVTDAGTELSGAQFGAFFYNVLNEEGKSFTLYSLSGAPREAFEQFPMPRSTAIFHPTFHGEGIMRLDDVTKDPRFGNNPPYNGMPEGHLPVRSYLAVPVISRSGEVLGGLFFGHAEAGVFTEQAEQIVTGIADQAAIAIENARLYSAIRNELKERKRTQERLRELNETLEQRVQQRTAELEEANAQLKDQIAERERTERTLERTNSALTQSNRELQDFAYVASHDLQEPLRKISSFADLLRADYEGKLDETGTLYLERMQEAAARMSSLIRDLLSFSRVATRGQPFEEIDLDEVMEEVLSDLELRIAETGGHIEAAALPSIQADPTQMRQLLQNLIGNALKFHREGVPPVVRVRATIERARLAPGRPEEKVCRLEVSDNGIGFEEKYLDRIFSPFQRLHGRSRYPGTGIGLAVCRRIVERHHGTISAKSTPGEGATFIVTLPVFHPEDPEV